MPAAETVSVGAVVTFAVPPAQLTPNRRIEWSSSQKTVATVPSDVGRATALGVGTANIIAVDLNSASNCRDRWYGDLIVR
ncbi:MAG TPA: Ig-like domain-containing protein [Gemmatimonadaceae bacterium]|nr:Ig-like domain-containing protein [Gemmatimonadaceae bacterium]